MKNSRYFCLIICVFFCSCATKMNIAEAEKLKVPDEFVYSDAADMEFIGFKADTINLSTSSKNITIIGSNENYSFLPEYECWKVFKTDTTIKKLGSVLESKNIAFDKSYAYFGIYSLQELELYKSQKRFVTFVQVNKNKIEGKVNNPGYIPSLCLSSAGLGCTLGVLPFIGNRDVADLVNKFLIAGIALDVGGLLFALIPCSTELIFSGEYEIYVYDTINKQIIYRDSVTVQKQDTFKGSYFHSDTDLNAVNEYYASFSYNAILQKYVEVNRFIRSYDK